MRATSGELGRVGSELLHDLAAELDTLRAWAFLVAEGARRGGVTATDAGTLQSETERVGTLVSDLLGWITRPDPALRFEPASRLERTVRWVRRFEGVRRVRLRTQGVGDALLAGPGTFFDRIAANLIRNAMRHADRQVRVTLAAGPHDARPGLALSVEDDGCGIPPELEGRLFTPGVHAEPGGHGLGLSSTAWLVEQLGGIVRPPGRSPLGGASFSVWLPSATEPAVSGGTGPVAGLTVMVIDDDPAVRHVVGRLLRSAGVGVLDPEPGPRLVEALLGGELGADALLLDRNLGRMDGLELWRRLREAQPELAARTALLSGGMAPDAPDELVLLQKPVTREALLSWLQQAAASRR